MQRINPQTGKPFSQAALQSLARINGETLPDTTQDTPAENNDPETVPDAAQSMADFVALGENEEAPDLGNVLRENPDVFGEISRAHRTEQTLRDYNGGESLFDYSDNN